MSVTRKLHRRRCHYQLGLILLAGLLENADSFDQLHGLMLQARSRGSTLFDQRSILLCRLIHVPYRFTYLSHTRALFQASCADFSNN